MDFDIEARRLRMAIAELDVMEQLIDALQVVRTARYSGSYPERLAALREAQRILEEDDA
jgi:hypothetical protein